LNAKGVKNELEYWDGHKHVDIAIPAEERYNQCGKNKKSRRKEELNFNPTHRNGIAGL
jgi:hypothetical protein